MNPSFSIFSLTGDAAAEFLQGQITADVNQLNDRYTPTAICNLKGRVDFGLWIQKQSETAFQIVISTDCADAFAAHVKKYGAFSKITLSEANPIFISLKNDVATFSETEEGADETAWLAASIAQGNVIITDELRGECQPQELRLHQRGGVHYDKGCYLGQEVVARIWFKAAPKAWLHRVALAENPTESDLLGKRTLVLNSIKTDTGYEALVVARPEHLAEADCTILDLPDALNGSVAREV